MTQAGPTLIATAKVVTVHPSTSMVLDATSEELNAVIRRVGHCGLDRVRAIAMDGRIVLRGTVRSFYLKQLAQEAVRPLAIGAQIENDLRVHG